MYGSRNHTGHGSGRDTSIEALNRTIEGLEARIEGLMGQGGRRQPADMRTGDDPVAAIRARQDMLSRGRPSQPPAYAASTQAQPGAQSWREDALPRRDQDIQTLAEAIAEMRRELKADIRASLSGELDTLRRELHGLAGETLDAGMPDDLRRELARIAASIDRIDGGNGTADTLRLELDAMRATIDRLAREDSLRALESRWQAVEDRISGIDVNGLRDDIVNLAYRVDDIRDQLAAMPQSGATREIDARIAQLSAAIEELARQSRLPAGDMARQFEFLGERLDEITRAVAALQAQPAAAVDATMIERLEARIGALAKKMESMETFHLSADVGGRLDAMADRVSQLADDEAIGRLDARLAHLQRMLEAGAGAGESSMLPRLSDEIAQLSGKIERIGAVNVGEQLAARLDDLAERIDAMQRAELRSPAIPESVIGRLESLISRAESNAYSVDPLPGMESLEARLSDIARRLDQSVAASAMQPVADPGIDRLESRLADIAAKLDRAAAPSFPGNDDILRGLEEQIANLSRQIASGPVQAGSGELDHRLAAIEEHLATNDEYVIEAARQAAETALSAYASRAAGSGASAQQVGNIEIITALADDLKALEALSRKSEDRTSRAFEAVQDTLLKIASRLEKLDARDASRPVEPPRQPQMPKADLGVFDVDTEENFIDRDAAEPPVEEINELGRGAHQARSPKEAAALAAAFAEEHEVEDSAEPAGKPASERASFLAGLASRIRPRRNAPASEAEPRFTETDVPPLDPSGELDARSANIPLEPGSGAPDINRILQKVREAQAREARGDAGAMPGDKAEFLASARRAAMAAAAEVETLGAAKKSSKGSDVLGLIKARRRPILMAVGAVLLAIMSMPLISGFIGGDEQPRTVSEAPAIVETRPADATETADAANTDVAPSVTEAPAAETADAATAPAPETMSAANEAVPPVAAPEVPEIGMQAPVVNEMASAPDTSAPASTKPSPAAETEAKLVADLDALPEGFIPPSLRTAAMDLDPLAFYEIGARFTDGRGTPVDLSRAAVWYQRAADLGHAPSQYRLANFYEKGSGVERDIDKAKTWYQLAAEQGNASAMHNLAVLYATAGAAPDYPSAAAWFAKAANLGVRDSQVNLAILYARGDGVTRDLEQSYKWFAIAANDGDKDAATKRDEVYNALRPEQAEAARALVANWKAEPLDHAANAVEVPAEWGGTETRTASVDMSKAIRNIQAILNNNGFDAGPADGIMGTKTVNAIKAFQTSVGMEPTGEVTDELVRKLLARNN